MADATGFTLWFTGMLCSGKSTLANYVAARLRQVGRHVEVLDEDELKPEFWAELQDSRDDRQVITRRLGSLAAYLSRNDVCTLVACTSPYKAARDDNRRRIARYMEVFTDCPTEDLMKRDSGNRYKKALNGELPNFVGITDPYEPPSSPEMVLHTNEESVEQCGLRLFQAMLDLGYVSGDELKVITGKKMRPLPPSKRTKPSKVKPAAKAKARPAPKKGKKK